MKKNYTNYYLWSVVSGLFFIIVSFLVVWQCNWVRDLDFVVYDSLMVSQNFGNFVSSISDLLILLMALFSIVVGIYSGQAMSVRSVTMDTSAGLLRKFVSRVFKKSSVHRIVFVIFSLVLVYVLKDLLKDFFAIDRPFGVVVESGFSFPSGHSALAGAAFASVAYFSFGLNGRVAGRWVRIIAIFIAIIVLLTRLLLGIHWLSDVIAGGLFGFAVVSLLTYFFRNYLGLNEQG